MDLKPGPAQTEQVMRFLTRHPVFTLVCASLLAFGAFAYFRMYSGYCWKEHRFLPVDEKIRASIPGAVPSALHSGTYFSKGQLIPYDSLDEFLKLNPDCCYFVNRENRFGREEYPRPDDFDDGPPYDPGFLSQFLDGFSGMMAFEYRQNYIDHEGVQRSRLVSRTRWVKACGGVYHD